MMAFPLSVNSRYDLELPDGDQRAARYGDKLGCVERDLNLLSN